MIDVGFGRREFLAAAGGLLGAAGARPVADEARAEADGSPGASMTVSANPAEMSTAPRRSIGAIPRTSRRTG